VDDLGARRGVGKVCKAAGGGEEEDERKEMDEKGRRGT